MRAHRFLGLKFERQKPIEPYIVDFVCMDRASVIELDDTQHGNQMTYDRRRDAWLTSQRGTVLRFWNHETMDQTENVLERIRQAVEGEPSPLLPLPQAGERSQARPHSEKDRGVTGLTYLALGDSYTIGEGVAADARWPVQLVALLRAHGVAIKPPTMLATTGWTTGELSAAMDAADFAPPYALVSLLIGVNNQYRGLALDAYRAEFSALLGRAIALAGARPARVIVLSIPDWGVTAYARAGDRDGNRIGREIDDFNAAAQTIVARAGARWVDITPISRRHADWLTADGLHPSAPQYAAWAQAAVPAAQAALASA